MRAFRHALRRRCPACGGHPIFVTWSRMLPNCPRCGLQLERGERGYWLGAWFVNLMLAETAFTAWLAGCLWATWPEPSWTLLQAGGIAVAVLVPVAAFPWSKTLFLAFDLRVRPPTEDDFRAPGEPAARRRAAPPS